MGRRASKKYRKRTNNHWERRLDQPGDLEAHFPLYWKHYQKYRSKVLPKGWMQKRGRLKQMQDQFIVAASAYSAPGLALAFFKEKKDKRAISNWFSNKFQKIREELGDGIVQQTCLSAPLGQPCSGHPDRLADREAVLKENPEYCMKAQQCGAMCSERMKAERDKERSDVVATSLAQVYVNNEYVNITALANRILHKPINFVSDINIPFATHSLPFGKATVFEALQHGLSYERLFHFNFCITSRGENEEECHRYLSGCGAKDNPIFSPTNPGHNTLTRNMLLQSDVRFTTVCSYKANADNGKDTLILALESQLQGVFHKKAPMGTLGFRWDKAGRPDYRWTDDQERVCSLMLVWSESKLLKAVQDGVLRINPTKISGPSVLHSLYNNKEWDDESWEPVVLSNGVDSVYSNEQQDLLLGPQQPKLPPSAPPPLLAATATTPL